MSIGQQAERLAEAVLAWAREPRDHGCNPYTLDFVKLADNISAGKDVWPSMPLWPEHPTT